MSDATQSALSKDGEISQQTDNLEAIIQPLEHTEKEKRIEFNTPPLVLWDRPFPDPAKYDKVELYLDPDFSGHWRYSLLLRWKSGDMSWSQTLCGYDYSDRDEALQAGIERYKWRVQEILEASKLPQKFKFKEFREVSLVAFLGFGIITFIAVYLISSDHVIQVKDLAGSESICLLLSLLLGFLVANTKDDPRG